MNQVFAPDVTNDSSQELLSMPRGDLFRLFIPLSPLDQSWWTSEDGVSGHTKTRPKILF